MRALPALKDLDHFFKIFYTFVCKKAREKLQTRIWKILSKPLEKFKHRHAPQNFWDNPLLCSFSLQLICFENSRFMEIIRHWILIQTLQFLTCLPTCQQSRISPDLETVVTSWSYCSPGKWRIRPEVTVFEALRHISKAFHEAYTIVLRLLRIESHNGSTSWYIQHILWLISPFKQRDEGEILVKVGQQVSIIFWIHRFLKTF